MRSVGRAGAVGNDGVFDLASITKTCVALTTSLAVRSGAFAWQTQCQEILPELAGTLGGRASVAQLLSHRAGLAAHRELFLAGQDGSTISRKELLARAASAARPEPAEVPVYSDLGYMLVGEMLEVALGAPLDEVVRTHLTAPLGIEIGSARQWRARYAEAGGGDTAVPFVRTEIVAARGGVVRGQVHDDNAWAIAGGGSAGHAGLFGTISGLAGLSELLLDAARGTGPWAEIAQPLLERRPQGTLRLGLDGIPGPASMAGRLAGKNTFGHLGFTGTSFWCDPDAGLATYLLTNRVYPSRHERRIRAARPRVHEALTTLAQTA